MLADVNAFNALQVCVRVRVFACLVCCVYVLASPVRSDGINDLQYVHTRPHTYTFTLMLAHARGYTFVYYACATPSTHIRRQHDPLFVLCVRTLCCVPPLPLRVPSCTRSHTRYGGCVGRVRVCYQCCCASWRGVASPLFAMYQMYASVDA